jgi:predicted RNA-binding Zn-ribbon protein involved in translation (DUF1610 family)
MRRTIRSGASAVDQMLRSRRMLTPRQVVWLLAAILFVAIFWRVIVWLLMAIVGRVWRWIDARREKTPYPCPVCGYDIRATPHGCPECGTKLRWGMLPHGRRE